MVLDPSATSKGGSRRRSRRRQNRKKRTTSRAAAHKRRSKERTPAIKKSVTFSESEGSMSQCGAPDTSKRVSKSSLDDNAAGSTTDECDHDQQQRPILKRTREPSVSDKKIKNGVEHHLPTVQQRKPKRAISSSLRSVLDDATSTQASIYTSGDFDIGFCGYNPKNMHERVPRQMEGPCADDDGKGSRLMHLATLQEAYQGEIDSSGCGRKLPVSFYGTLSSMKERFRSEAVEEGTTCTSDVNNENSSISKARQKIQETVAAFEAFRHKAGAVLCPTIELLKSETEKGYLNSETWLVENLGPVLSEDFHESMRTRAELCLRCNEQDDGGEQDPPAFQALPNSAQEVEQSISIVEVEEETQKQQTESAILCSWETTKTAFLENCCALLPSIGFQQQEQNYFIELPGKFDSENLRDPTEQLDEGNIGKAKEDPQENKALVGKTQTNEQRQSTTVESEPAQPKNTDPKAGPEEAKPGNYSEGVAPIDSSEATGLTKSTKSESPEESDSPEEQRRNDSPDFGELRRIDSPEVAKPTREYFEGIEPMEDPIKISPGFYLGEGRHSVEPEGARLKLADPEGEKSFVDDMSVEASPIRNSVSSKQGSLRQSSVKSKNDCVTIIDIEEIAKRVKNAGDYTAYQDGNVPNVYNILKDPIIDEGIGGSGESRAEHSDAEEIERITRESASVWSKFQTLSTRNRSNADDFNDGESWVTQGTAQNPIVLLDASTTDKSQQQKEDHHADRLLAISSDDDQSQVSGLTTNTGKTMGTRSAAGTVDVSVLTKGEIEEHLKGLVEDYLSRHFSPMNQNISRDETAGHLLSSLKSHMEDRRKAKDRRWKRSIQHTANSISSGSKPGVSVASRGSNRRGDIHKAQKAKQYNAMDVVDTLPILIQPEEDDTWSPLPHPRDPPEVWTPATYSAPQFPSQERFVAQDPPLTQSPYPAPAQDPPEDHQSPTTPKKLLADPNRNGIIDAVPIFEPEKPKQIPKQKLLADPNKNGMIDANWNPVRPPLAPTSSHLRVEEDRDDQQGSPNHHRGGFESGHDRDRHHDGEHSWLYQDPRYGKSTAMRDPRSQPQTAIFRDRNSPENSSKSSTTRIVKTQSSMRSVSSKSSFSRNHLPKRTKSVSFNLPPDDEDDEAAVAPTTRSSSSNRSQANNDPSGGMIRSSSSLSSASLREASIKRQAELKRISQRQASLLARGQRLIQNRSYR